MYQASMPRANDPYEAGMESEVRQSPLAALEASLNAMQKMLEELEARLSPVLGPSSPVLAKNPERERAFNKLGEIAMGFDATTKRLNSIMARIDL